MPAYSVQFDAERALQLEQRVTENERRLQVNFKGLDTALAQDVANFATNREARAAALEAQHAAAARAATRKANKKAEMARHPRA